MGEPKGSKDSRPLIAAEEITRENSSRPATLGPYLKIGLGGIEVRNLVTPKFKVDEGTPTELKANSLSGEC